MDAVEHQFPDMVRETVCRLCGEFVAVDNGMCAPCGRASQELDDIGQGTSLSEWDVAVFFNASRRHHVGTMRMP